MVLLVLVACPGGRGMLLVFAPDKFLLLLVEVCDHRCLVDRLLNHFRIISRNLANLIKGLAQGSAPSFFLLVIILPFLIIGRNIFHCGRATHSGNSNFTKSGEKSSRCPGTGLVLGLVSITSLATTGTRPVP